MGDLHREGPHVLCFVSEDIRDLGQFQKAKKVCEPLSCFLQEIYLHSVCFWIQMDHPYCRGVSRYYRAASMEKPCKASARKFPGQCHRMAARTDGSGSATTWLLCKISIAMNVRLATIKYGEKRTLRTRSRS